MCFSTLVVFFFNDAVPTEIYTLSLHDALPIWTPGDRQGDRRGPHRGRLSVPRHGAAPWRGTRSEEHTSELQSQFHLVCRLLLEKKKKIVMIATDKNIISAFHQFYEHFGLYLAS